MKIGILSRGKALYSTQRLRDAARARGHRVVVIDPLRCYMNIATLKPTVHYNGKALEDLDAIIPRIGASITFYGTAVVRQFEMMGVFSLNDSMAISQSRDKLRSLQLLSSHGIGLPVTGFASSPDDTDDLLSLVGGAPVVVKLLAGAQGKGVVLAETRNAADSVIDAFRGLAADFLVQHYVKEAAGSDIRCFVIDGKVVAAMQRQAAEGEFRSNLHSGGSAQPVKITAQERSAAVRAARIVGLGVAGVDILRSRHGPLVIEVNSSPGLEGIEETTGVDIAGLIIEHIERRVRHVKHARRAERASRAGRAKGGG
jgi:ribosomal protein S6--L-glutamate ligase